MTWILPDRLITSHCATDTEASTWEFIKSLAEKSAPSLLARSKPLPSKTLLQKWRKGKLIRVQSGLTYGLSLGTHFVEKWMSSQVDSLASPSQQPGSETPIPIQDTSSLQSTKESEYADLPLFSSKTSRESSQPNCRGTDGVTPQELPFCFMSSASWKEWVTQQRQEYSARLKSAHPTSESGCSSWPTAAARDWKGCGNAVDRKDGKHRMDTLEAVVKFGQPVPESHSTNGSRQECADWGSIVDPFGEVMFAGSASTWPTPSICGNHNRKGASETSGDGLSTAAKQWATPQSRDHRSGGQERWENPEERSRNLNDQLATTSNTQNAKLNPRWVETLMGVPQRWTMPDPEQSNRTDELRMLGNGCVPDTVAKAFVTLAGRHLNHKHQ